LVELQDLSELRNITSVPTMRCVSAPNRDPHAERRQLTGIEYEYAQMGLDQDPTDLQIQGGKSI
jgi:hypothetical protein